MFVTAVMRFANHPLMEAILLIILRLLFIEDVRKQLLMVALIIATEGFVAVKMAWMGFSRRPSESWVVESVRTYPIFTDKSVCATQDNRMT